MKCRPGSINDLAQTFSMLLLLYHNKNDYHLFNDNSYRIITSESELLAEDFDLKRFALMVMGLCGWKRFRAIMNLYSGSGGFLRHFAKNSTYFKTKHNMNFPFKMSAWKIVDEQKLITNCLEYSKNKDEYFQILNSDLSKFLKEVYAQLISDCQLKKEKRNVDELEDFAEELFKTISPIFESIQRQQRRQFLEIEKLRKYVNFVNKEIGVVKQDVKEMRACIKKIENIAMLDNLHKEEIGVVEEYVKKDKKRRDKIKDRIPKSEKYPYLVEMTNKYLLYKYK